MPSSALVMLFLARNISQDSDIPVQTSVKQSCGLVELSAAYGHRLGQWGLDMMSPLNKTFFRVRMSLSSHGRIRKAIGYLTKPYGFITLLAP